MAALETRTPSGNSARGRETLSSSGKELPHRLNLTDRENLTVTGVKDVRSFDETEVLLETGMGILTIRGSGLHVNRLTLERGEVDVTGRIDSLVYSNGGGPKRQGESLMGRLFR